MRQLRSLMHVNVACLAVFLFILVGCGGGGGNGGGGGGNPSADLTVALTVDKNGPHPGDTVTYTITASAGGPQVSPAVKVTEALPSAVTLVSATASTGSYSGGVWTIGDLAVGASATLALKVTVNVTVPAGTTITDTVTASESTTVVDPNPSNNTASVSFTVVVPPMATISSVSPSHLWLDFPSLGQFNNPLTLNLSGSDILANDQCNVLLAGMQIAIISQSANPPNQLQCGIGIDTHHFTATWGEAGDCRGGGGNCSNTEPWGFAANGNNLLRAASTGMYVALTTGPTKLADLGTVREGVVWRFNNDGSSAGSFALGAALMELAFDEAAGMVVIPICTVNGCSVGMWSIHFDTDNVLGSAATGGTFISSVDSANKLACAALPNEHKVALMSVGQGTQTVMFTNPGNGTTPPQVGTTPRAVTIVNGDCLVSSTDGQLTKVKLADATTDGAIGTLTGLGKNDHFQMTVLSSGSASGTAILLDEEAALIVFFDVSTLTEIRKQTISNLSPTQATLTLAADNIDAAALIAVDDTSKKVVQFFRVPVSATGSTLQLTSTSVEFPSGLAINPVGGQIGIFGTGAIEIKPNN